MKIITTIILALVAVTTRAHDVEIDGIYYNLFKSVAIVTYKGERPSEEYTYSGDIVIPEKIEYAGKTYFVKEIGTSAFEYSKGLTSVIIPNSVTKIENEAFRYCIGLKSITIPNSVKEIRTDAFSGCI